MIYLLVVMMVVLSGGQSMAETLTSRDFATGYYLEVDKERAIYALELPEEVYRTVKSADLRDVRIFNGEGESVPHDFRRIEVLDSTLQEKEFLPFFPLHQETVSENGTGFSLQVKRDAAGAIVNINPEPTVADEDKPITGYLLDLSGLKRPPSELGFLWSNDSDSAVFTVTIEQSSDLIRWVPLVYRATLADLQFGGQRIEKRLVKLPRQPQKYLKLSWMEKRQSLNLQQVSSFSEIIETRRKHRWVSLYNGTVAKDSDLLAIEFESNYSLPTSSIQVRFPETNSIARLLVQSRADNDQGWKSRCEQVFHDLSFDGAVIENEPCHFSPTSDSLWRVVVKEDGAGLLTGNRKPTLQLGWQPNELLFVGRGTSPYLLAFGSGKVAMQERAASSGMLLQMLQDKSHSQVAGIARLGKKINLGGAQALQSPVKPPPWKKWLLWLILLLGVGLLGYMARSLSKEMTAAEEKRVS